MIIKQLSMLKINLILVTVLVGITLCVSCERHTDYDQLKAENENLKEQLELWKGRVMQQGSPFPYAHLDNRMIKKGQRVTLQATMGYEIPGSMPVFILKDPETGEYTDTMEYFGSLPIGTKEFTADKTGEFTIEGIMVFNRKGSIAKLPFENLYKVTD
jgi:hypothetical protein